MCSLPIGPRLLAALLFSGSTVAAAEPTRVAAPPPSSAGWRYEELRRIAAPEARQGLAVDGEFIYPIDNFTVAKYRKSGGERVALWRGEENGPIIHLNAGVVFNRRLYCAHSNFPGVPMQSSIEMFDPATLKHVGSHSFGRTDGSLTWIDRRDGKWIACFVHYGRRGGEPGRGPEWTHLVEFDDQWRRLRGWTLPAELIKQVGARGYSVSGGAFGPRGLLFATGHDEPELYVLDFPAAGSTLKWVATIPIPAEGQAFAWDPNQKDVLYSVWRKTREVIVGRVIAP